MDDAQNTPGSGPADPGAQPASPLPPQPGKPASRPVPPAGQRTPAGQPAPANQHGPAGASAPPPGPGPKPQEPGGHPAAAVPPAPAAAAPATPVPGTVAPAAAVPAAVPAPSGAEAGGRTAISEQAVAKVAAIAARAVPGVHTLGSGGGRTLGAVRDAVAGSDSSATAGVNVEVGETEAAVDITLVAEYGTPLTGIADNVRQAVYTAVEDLVGLNVVEVNVSIADVHIPEVRQEL